MLCMFTVKQKECYSATTQKLKSKSQGTQKKDCLLIADTRVVLVWHDFSSAVEQLDWWNKQDETYTQLEVSSTNNTKERACSLPLDNISANIYLARMRNKELFPDVSSQASRDAQVPETCGVLLCSHKRSTAKIFLFRSLKALKFLFCTGHKAWNFIVPVDFGLQFKKFKTSARELAIFVTSRPVSLLEEPRTPKASNARKYSVARIGIGSKTKRQNKAVHKASKFLPSCNFKNKFS